MCCINYRLLPDTGSVSRLYDSFRQGRFRKTIIINSPLGLFLPFFHCSTADAFGYNVIKPFGTVLFSTGDIVALPTVGSEMTPSAKRLLTHHRQTHFQQMTSLTMVNCLDYRQWFLRKRYGNLHRLTFCWSNSLPSAVNACHQESKLTHEHCDQVVLIIFTLLPLTSHGCIVQAGARLQCTLFHLHLCISDAQ